MVNKKEISAVLLCAGEGTRMNDTRTNKVCYEVAGVPAVIRTINNLKKAGIEKFAVVVGCRSDKVMQCLDGIDGIVYAYQPRRDGTGSAALCGLKALASMGITGGALISMGDKIISADVFEKLIGEYSSGGCSAVMAVQPKEFNESGGRICEKNGKVCGIYEKTDSCLLALGALREQTPEAYSKALDDMNLNEKKRAKLYNIAIKKPHLLRKSVTLGGEEFTYGGVEACRYVNTATYILDIAPTIEALGGLSSDNAQGEIYLTDAVNKLIADGGAKTVVIEDKAKMLTYSTMDELIALNRYFGQATDSEGLKFASEWINVLNGWGDGIKDEFEQIYGCNPELISQRREALIDLLGAYIKRYGDRKVVITRSPGRVNLLGRHIEHRGGSINVMSIDRETLLVAGARDDGIVHISNTDSKFPDYEFSISDTIDAVRTDDWVDFIEDDRILKMVVESKGEWINYVKAAVLRIQMAEKNMTLCGMDMLFEGNIPPAAGLSSSSSIVVATSEAAIALNDIDMQAKEFIHLCGEGEWFVGSRGGAGDHAAMKCGVRDMITHLDFCPFEISESVYFPSDYNVVVANSYVEAKKSAGAKDIFNQKVACYEFGFMLVKKQNPEFADKLKYLKDIDPRRLGVPQSRIYEMLLRLPEYMTPDEISAALPEYSAQIARIQKTHNLPEKYEIRSTILYGVAECLRADKCIDLLKEEKYEELGKLMNISHNGDRVFKDGEPYDYSVPDEYLKKLIDDLRSEDLERVSAAQIYNQPGGYGCSTKTIDALVDRIISLEGVMGAELSGAGLGGCIIILVKKSSTDALLKDLKEFYYDKNSLPMGAQVFIPVAGSGRF